MKHLSNSAEETFRIAADFAKTLSRGDVVALYGDLGAGKTAFTGGLAAGLSITARVTSPTFTIVNEYPGEIPLFHFDMYRLSGPDELFEIGWDDYLQRGGICVLEWAENVTDALPPEAIRISIDKTGENTREITISARGARCENSGI